MGTGSLARSGGTPRKLAITRADSALHREPLVTSSHSKFQSWRTGALPVTWLWMCAMLRHSSCTMLSIASTSSLHLGATFLRRSSRLVLSGGGFCHCTNGLMCIRTCCSSIAPRSVKASQTRFHTSGVLVAEEGTLTCRN
eukprot:765203-Hanusia_phi.AAC.4